MRSIKGILVLVAAAVVQLVMGQGYQLRAGTVYQDFQDKANWVSYDGTVSTDTTHVKLGTQSLMLTANPGYSAHMRKAISTSFANVSTISFWVYAQFPVNSNNWHAASIYLTSDGFQNYFLATTQQIHPGWSKLTFSKGDFTAYGSPSWNNAMTTLQVALFGDTSQGMSLSFADMELNGYSRPKVIIAFDDDYTSSYTYGYQYLKKYGFSGTEYVISSTVDGAGRTSSAQLNEMYNYGWDMCNHTTTHPDLRTLTESQVISEYQNCENFLVSKGWTRNEGYRHLAYPSGFFNSTVIAADAEAELLTARTVMKTLPQANQLDSPYLLYSQVPDSTSQTHADMIASINQVVANGGALELTFHNITTSPQVAIDWSASDFESIIDYVASLKSQGKLDVVTLTQWYAGLNAAVQPAALSGIQTNASWSAVGIANSLILYLNGAAPYAETATLSSSSSAVHIPSSVTISTGSNTISIPFNTTWVNANTTVTLSATLNGQTMSCQFLLKAEAPNYIVLDSSSVQGGNSVTAHVWMLGPSQGLYVNITGNVAGVSFSPSSVYIPSTWFHGDFTIKTPKVKKATVVTVKATYNGYSCTIPLTITAP